jgi:hypothetical protein
LDRVAVLKKHDQIEVVVHFEEKMRSADLLVTRSVSEGIRYSPSLTLRVTRKQPLAYASGYKKTAPRLRFGLQENAKCTTTQIDSGIENRSVSGEST